MTHKIKLFFALLVCCAAPVLAQSGQCSEIVQAALANLETICANAGRNQVCYGNVSIQTETQAGASGLKFEAVGDIADLNAIKSMRLSPMDEVNQLWGVAIMRVQASLPDTLPGQNATFIMLGDVQITNAAPVNSDLRPMQAFYVQTGIRDTKCTEAPESGLTIHTPKGAGQVTFSVNGVDMSAGSTVFFQAQRGGQMRVSTLQGTAVIDGRDGFYYPILAGTRATVPLDDKLLPEGPPDSIEAYNLEEFEDLPLDFLDEDIEIHEPFTDEEFDDFFARLESGDPICGEDPYPSCEELPYILGGEACSLAEDGESFACSDTLDTLWDDSFELSDEDLADFEDDIFNEDDFSDEDFSDDTGDEDFSGEESGGDDGGGDDFSGEESGGDDGGGEDFSGDESGGDDGGEGE